MTNETLHTEIARLLTSYGFIAIVKVLEVEAAKRHVKWSQSPGNGRIADRMCELRKILGECWQKMARGA